MTDDVDIRSGGLIAVDTESLRLAAARMVMAAAECAELAAHLRAAGVASAAAGVWDPSPAGRAVEAEERADALAHALRRRADAYDLVEQVAAGRLASFGSGAVAAEARHLWQGWSDARHVDVEAQLAGALWPAFGLMPAVWAATAAVRFADRGVIDARTPPLSGPTPAVALDEVSRSAVRPPKTLADIAARVPGDGEERVRVESYDTPTGRRHIVYIAGTQNLDGPRYEPWDMASNLELYFGHTSASYAATVRAIEAAGVRDGESVSVVGHSQGGMIAARLAREAPFDVRTLVTFASPVEAQLDADVTNVTVRHTDDPIAALAAGGVPGVAGSRDSFVAERLADPQPRLADFALSVHSMTAYRETATMIDTSDDPRVGAFHVQLAALGTAAGVAAGYRARREFVVAATPASESRAPARQPGGSSRSPRQVSGGGASAADGG